MTSYTIYQHIFPDGKQYIGITRRQPEVRWRPGGYHYKNNPPMWKAIQEVGWDNIQHIIWKQMFQKKRLVKKNVNILNSMILLIPIKDIIVNEAGFQEKVLIMTKTKLSNCMRKGQI